jgi:hypothetical protein
VKWLALLGLAWLPLLIGRAAITEAAGLVDLASAPHPYFIPSHALLLYLWTPLVALSGGVALLTPGLLLTWSSRREGFAVWLMRALAISLLSVSVLASASALAAGVAWRSRHRESATNPEGSAFAVALAFVVPGLLIAALAPKLLWESVNGDGAHAFETARLAVRQFVPFWDPAAGPIAFFPGMSTVLFAYPASWFVRLFGETEAAIRLPYFLVLAAMHAAIVAIASQNRAILGRWRQVLIWMALVAYTVVQAFSSTYDPYSADLSMPGLPDTLQIFTFLGFVHAYLARRWGWTAVFLALTLLSSPAGLVLVLFWLGAIVLTTGRVEWPAARRCAGILVAVFAMMVAMPVVLSALSLPQPGKEHGLVGLLRRFAFLQFTDWHRLLWVIVPSGIYPFAAFVMWKRLDPVGRALLIVITAQFAMFFVQAHVMIHQFAPAMLLPLVAVWRTSAWEGRPWHGALAGAAATIAILVSLPVHGTPVVAARQIGRTVADSGRGYETLAPTAYLRTILLNDLFPEDYKAEVPEQSYGGSALAWGIYSHRNPTPAADINYVLTEPGAPAPPGARLHSSNDAGALYVKDDAVWRRHRELRPPTPAGSRVYWTPRGMLFHGRPRDGGPWILDVPAWLTRMGFDVEGLAGRLGKE